MNIQRRTYLLTCLLAAAVLSAVATGILWILFVGLRPQFAVILTVYFGLFFVIAHQLYSIGVRRHYDIRAWEQTEVDLESLRFRDPMNGDSVEILESDQDSGTKSS